MKNKTLKQVYKKLTKNYSSDYFSEAMQATIKCSLMLIDMIKTGEFEHDTLLTDRILYDLRYAINDVDI